MTNIFIFTLTIALLTLGCSTNSAQTKRPDNQISNILDSASIQNAKTKSLCTGWYYVLDTINDFKYQLDKSDEIFYLNPSPIVIKDNIVSTEIYETKFLVGLGMQLDDFGTKRWADATGKYITKRLAFILDNKLIIAAKVNAQITMGATAINRTEYNRQDIENFKKLLDKR